MEFTEKLSHLRMKKIEIEKLQSDFVKISSSIFEDFYKYIFDKYPKLDSFGWNQYTPYFNDGDSCVFHAYTDYLNINGDYVDESDWINPTNVINWGTWNTELRIYEGRSEEENKKFDKNLSDACVEIIEFLSNFDDDFYLRKFGDHAEITINRSGVDISDLDHE